MLGEVLDDLYVRRFRKADAGTMSRADALAIASIAVANPGAPVEPAGGDPDGLPAMRRRLAVAVREELERRKRLAGADDLRRPAHAAGRALRGPAGAGIAERLRARYRVVLVDEFQDTDPIQWEIMRRAFGAGTLVLIGDPKQAIYAFRGADVYAYLEAAAGAAAPGHARGQLAQRPGAARRLRRAVRGREARPRGDRLPRRARGAGQRQLAARRRARAGAAAGADRAPRRAVDGAHAAPDTRAWTRRASTSRRISPPTSCACWSSGATVARRAGAAGPRRGARPHAPQAALVHERSTPPTCRP